MEFLAWQRIRTSGERPTPCKPWEWVPSEETFDRIEKAGKSRRRAVVDEHGWNVYTPVTGVVRDEPITNENQANTVSGMVLDYDAGLNKQYLLEQLEKVAPELWPQFMERSLSGNLRLVWVFDKPYAVINSAHCEAIWRNFGRMVKVDRLHPGLDPMSWNPAQRWTNGTIWETVSKHPHLPTSTLLSILVDTAKTLNMAASANVDLAVVHKEVERRWPGRWAGDFVDGAKGVRFWDESADNPNGCCIRPDGCVCVTGDKAWVPWEDILGKAWVQKHREERLEDAIENTYFDGQRYWQCVNGVWRDCDRADIVLRLTNRGFSNRTGKGETISQAGRILNLIQTQHRIDYALPMVSSPKGLITFQGHDVLNTTRVTALEPAESGGFTDFPFIHHFLWQFFDHPEDMPLEHFLAWLKRSYESLLYRESKLGQAVFICGPKNNGKNLINARIVQPLLGGIYGDPYSYLTGSTSFNSELFDSFHWRIDDAEAPREGTKGSILSKIKDAVVNRTHSYHKKFGAKTTIEWIGRILCTLNDDPEAVQLLPEVNSNTEDKLMFFASTDYDGVFPESRELEATLAKEIRHFARWLLNYKPPEEVLERTRIGVKSYFDRKVLAIGRQQQSHYNLREMLTIHVHSSWSDGEDEKTMTVTHLLSEMHSNPLIDTMAKDYKTWHAVRALTALSREPHSGVYRIDHNGSSDRRLFKIVKKELPAA